MLRHSMDTTTYFVPRLCPPRNTVCAAPSDRLMDLMSARDLSRGPDTGRYSTGCDGTPSWAAAAGAVISPSVNGGSGVAAQIALGRDVGDAFQQAQHYTWQTLNRAFAAGRGQRVPARTMAFSS